MKGVLNVLSYTFNPSYLEVKISIFLTSIILLLLMIIGVHSDFFYYQSFLIEISTNILVAQISLMGVLITALALMVTILNNSDYVKSINDLDIEKNVDCLLDDFPYVSVMILFHIIISFVLIFMMKSNLKIASIHVFYTLLTIYIYIFINILVRVSLIPYIMVSVFKGIRNLMKLSILDTQVSILQKNIYVKRQLIKCAEKRKKHRRTLRKRRVRNTDGQENRN